MKMLNKIIGSSIAVAAVLAFSASTTQAANLLTDPNFAGPFTGNPITPTGPGSVDSGWANYGGSSSSDMSSANNLPYNFPTVTTALFTANTTWGGEGVYQIITTPLIAGATYTFSMYALTDNAYTGYATPLALDLNFVGPWNGTAYPSLPAGGANGIVMSANDNQFANEPGLNTWTQFSVSMSAANVAGIYGILIQPQTINGGTPPTGYTAQNIYFDNASLTVPEPASLALLSMGLAVPFYFIRRRKS